MIDLSRWTQVIATHISIYYSQMFCGYFSYTIFDVLWAFRQRHGISVCSSARILAHCRKNVMETVSPRPLNRSGNSAESPDSGAGIVPYGLRFAASAILLCLMLLLTGCGSKTTVDILAESQTLFNRGKLEARQLSPGRFRKATQFGPKHNTCSVASRPRCTALMSPCPISNRCLARERPFPVKAVAAAAELEYQSGRLSVAIEDYRFLTETWPNRKELNRGCRRC